MTRYAAGAGVYDFVSLERLIYRSGRELAIELLSLQPGSRVVDIGCGTGLNFSLLQRGIGRSGSITGIDLSPHMLHQASRRVTRNQWNNVSLVQADAASIDRLAQPDGPFDAALFTYSLSIVADWTAAWTKTLALLKPGARVAVVDLSLPSHSSLLLTTLARLACFSGGVDPNRSPWKAVEHDTTDVTARTLRRGHIHVAVGTKRGHATGEGHTS